MTLQDLILTLTGADSQIKSLQNQLDLALKDKADNINALQVQINAIAKERDTAKALNDRNERVKKVIETGLLEYGKPYVFGATRGQNANFDCSSFTYWCFKKALNMDLHWASYTQAQSDGVFIDGFENALPGDLLCYNVTTGNRETWEDIDHVGIYCGNNKTLHTYKVGVGVKFEELTDTRKSQLKFIKRVLV